MKNSKWNSRTQVKILESSYFLPPSPLDICLLLYLLHLLMMNYWTTLPAWSCSVFLHLLTKKWVMWWTKAPTDSVSCKDTTLFNNEKLISSIKDWITVWIIHLAIQTFPLSVEMLMCFQAKPLNWIIKWYTLKNTESHLVFKYYMKFWFCHYCQNTIGGNFCMGFFGLFLIRYPHTAVV